MRLLAPEFSQSAEVDGTPYEVVDRQVVVLNPDHAAQLRQLGFRDIPPLNDGEVHDWAAPNLKRRADEPAGGAPVAGETLTGDGSGEGVGLVAAMSYPAIVAILLAEKVGFDDELPAQDLLLLTDTALAGVRARFADDTPPQYVLGEFVTAALASAGLTDLSDLQAALDAIEAQYEPFKAFDPNGDQRPGGTAPAAPATEQEAPAEDGGESGNLDTLYGSSVLPAIVEVGGYQVQLGGIVSAAFSAFDETLPAELSAPDAVKAWNDLEEPDREAKLAAIVEKLNADPEQVELLVPPANIVGRPEQEGAGADDMPEDPAEKPNFADMPHAELVKWLRDRKFVFRGNPSNAVAVQQAEDYWAEKHPAQ